MKDWATLAPLIVAVASFFVGAWKFLYNHIEHLRLEIREDLAEIRDEIKALREKL